MYFEDEFTKDKFNYDTSDFLMKYKNNYDKLCEDLDEVIQSYRYNESKYKGLKNELKQISFL